MKKGSRPLNAARELRQLMKRAGLSFRKFADLADPPYAGASSVQRYLTEEKWEDKGLPWSVVRRIEPALIGRGDPPITRDELYRLAEPVPVPPAQIDRALLIAAGVMLDRAIKEQDLYFTSREAELDALSRLYERLIKTDEDKRETQGPVIASTIIDFFEHSATKGFVKR